LLGLPSEPGRGLCQDLPFDLELAVLAAQAEKLFLFEGGETVRAKTIISIGLGYPLANTLLCRLELPSKLARSAAGSGQGHDLLFELSRIGS
jgi:hypothetical protein